jgi:RNA polymerase sigma factor (sigma-70 family)
MTRLSHEEECQLVAEAKAGSHAAHERLLEKFQKLLWKFALKFPSRNMEPDDMFQEAWILFRRAIHSFDPTRGHRFITWVYHCNRQLLQVIQETGLIRVGRSAGMNHPSHSRRARSRVLSIDAHYSKSNDGTIADELASTFDVEREVQHREELAALRQAISRLPKRARLVIEMRFDGKKLRQIGRIFGVSRERIRQIEQVANVTIARLIKCSPKKKIIRRRWTESEDQCIAQNCQLGWNALQKKLPGRSQYAIFKRAETRIETKGCIAVKRSTLRKVSPKNSRIGEDLTFRNEYMARRKGCEVIHLFPGTPQFAQLTFGKIVHRVGRHASSDDPHHIVAGFGHRWDVPTNLIAVCRAVHEWLTQYHDGVWLCLRSKIDNGEFDFKVLNAVIGLHRPGASCIEFFARRDLQWDWVEPIKASVIRDVAKEIKRGAK